jgi:hypothetical protein
MWGVCVGLCGFAVREGGGIGIRTGLRNQCPKTITANTPQDCDKLKKRLGVPLGVLDAEKREILDRFGVKFARFWETLSPGGKESILKILSERSCRKQ